MPFKCNFSFSKSLKNVTCFRDLISGIGDEDRIDGRLFNKWCGLVGFFSDLDRLDWINRVCRRMYERAVVALAGKPNLMRRKYCVQRGKRPGDDFIIK